MVNHPNRKSEDTFEKEARLHRELNDAVDEFRIDRSHKNARAVRRTHDALNRFLGNPPSDPAILPRA